MTSITRRRFVQGVAALPLIAGAPWSAMAGDPMIRYDIASEQGQQMLALYADAVARMKTLGPDDPMSWTWQWYTHFVSGATTKANEIARIFGSAGNTLASETWNTCQSHSGQNKNYFLPWHRMFIYYFERIIRQVCGDTAFTLPYWDYTSSDPAKRGVLPAQFLMPSDPVFGSLYRPDRSTLANSGQPIQTYQVGDPMDISAAMANPSYSTVGTVTGFCASIDNSIHGRIHVLTGTSKDMGAVPYAGQDPLFFVHHASIDRMWASWNRNGNTNPNGATWANKKFVFADAGGVRASQALKSVFNEMDLGYTYDNFITPPPTAPAMASAMRAMVGNQAAGTARPQRIAFSPSPAELGGAVMHVVLRPIATAPKDRVLGLSASQGTKRTYLVLKDLQTWVQPEVLYHIYLTPPNAHARLDEDNYVGNINFFDAEFHDHGMGLMGDVIGSNLYSFDVTDLLAAIGRSENAAARQSLFVSFVPGGIPRPGGKPIVSTIELVQQ